MSHSMNTLLPRWMRGDAQQEQPLLIDLTQQVTLQDGVDAQGNPTQALQKDLRDFAIEYLQYRNGQAATRRFRASPQQAMQIDVVHRCVSLIANDISDLEIQVRKRDGKGGKQNVADHPVLNLFKSPNPWMNQKEFIAYVARSLLLHGNAYVQKIADGGRVIRLRPFQPQFVDWKSVAPGELQYTVTFTPTNSQGQRNLSGKVTLNLSADDMIHLRSGMQNPDIPVGRSIVRDAARTIGLASEQQRFMCALATSMGMPGGIFKQDANNPPNQDSINTMKQQVKQMRGKPNRILLAAPGVDFEQMTMSSSDAELLESARFTRERISTFYGVPMAKVNDITKSTSFGRGIDSQNKDYVQHTLLMWVTIIEQSFTRALLWQNGPTDQQIEFNMSRLTQADVLTRHQAYQIAFQNGGMSPNEYRQREGLPKRTDPGGDEYHTAPGTAMEDNNREDDGENGNGDNDDG